MQGMGFEDALQSVLRRPRQQVAPDDQAGDQVSTLLAALGLAKDSDAGQRQAPTQQPINAQAQQVPQQPVPTGQMLTPTNQAAITRPRTVLEHSDPTAVRSSRFANSETSDAVSGMPEMQKNNYGANPTDTLQKHFNTLQTFEPTHKENRFVAALKGARDAVRLNARPGMGLAELVGTGIGGAGVGAATGVPGLYGKEIEMRKTGGDLQQALGLEKERAQVANLGMVPVQLNDGRTVMAPRAKAADLENKQQGVAQAGQRMDQRGDLTHKRLLVSQLNGLREFDPDDPKNASFVKELKANGIEPVKKDSGSMLQYVEGTDADGNATFNVINKGTGKANEVTGGNLPVKTEGQLGREAAGTREDKSLAARTKIAQMGIDARLQIAREKPSSGIDPDEKQALVDQWKQDAKDKRAEASRIQPKTQADLDRQRQLSKDAADLERSARQAQLKPTRRVSAVTQSPAPQSGGGKYTEADVRARATKAGKDPDIAVANARKAKLIP